MERLGASPRESTTIFRAPAFLYDLIAIKSHACGRRSVVFLDEVRILIAERPSTKSPTRTNGGSHVVAA